jgi:hypothetical protein
MGFTRKHALPVIVLGFLLLIALGCWIRVLTHLATQPAPQHAAHIRSVPGQSQATASALPLCFEPNFELAPGADPNQIRLRFDGVRRLALAEDESLRLILVGGEARQYPPVAYQMKGSQQNLVQVAYRLEARQVGFNLGEYDPSRPLIIDPVMIFSCNGSHPR